MAKAHENPLPTNSSLLGRLKDLDDHQSWQEFYRAYRRLIYGFARQHGLSGAEAEEVVQDTLLSVARTMHGFKYDPTRSSFKNWLGHLTRKRTVDYLRRRPRELPRLPSPRATDRRTGTAERVADPNSLPEARWQEEWEAQVLDAALEKLKRQVSAKQYQVFHLLVLKQQPVGRVAEALGISVAQVYLVKHRVMRAFKRMAEGLRQELE